MQRNCKNYDSVFQVQFDQNVEMATGIDRAHRSTAECPYAGKRPSDPVPRRARRLTPIGSDIGRLCHKRPTLREASEAFTPLASPAGDLPAAIWARLVVSDAVMHPWLAMSS